MAFGSGWFSMLIYLASPIDVAPGFIPVISYLDDAVIVAVVLRWVIRRSGADTIRRHWPGTATGLAIVEQRAGMRSSQRSGADSQPDIEPGRAPHTAAPSDWGPDATSVADAADAANAATAW